MASCRDRLGCDVLGLRSPFGDTLLGRPYRAIEVRSAMVRDRGPNYAGMTLYVASDSQTTPRAKRQDRKDREYMEKMMITVGDMGKRNPQENQENLK